MVMIQNAMRTVVLERQKKSRVDKIMRIPSSRENIEMADLRRDLVAERDKYNKLLQ